MGAQKNALPPQPVPQLRPSRPFLSAPQPQPHSSSSSQILPQPPPRPPGLQASWCPVSLQCPPAPGRSISRGDLLSALPRLPSSPGTLLPGVLVLHLPPALPSSSTPAPAPRSCWQLDKPAVLFPAPGTLHMLFSHPEHSSSPHLPWASVQQTYTSRLGKEATHHVPQRWLRLIRASGACPRP